MPSNTAIIEFNKLFSGSVTEHHETHRSRTDHNIRQGKKNVLAVTCIISWFTLNISIKWKRPQVMHCRGRQANFILHLDIFLSLSTIFQSHHNLEETNVPRNTCDASISKAWQTDGRWSNWSNVALCFNGAKNDQSMKSNWRSLGCSFNHKCFTTPPPSVHAIKMYTSNISFFPFCTWWHKTISSKFRFLPYSYTTIYYGVLLLCLLVAK